MPQNFLCGDSVNPASWMESHGLPNKVHLSPTNHRGHLFTPVFAPSSSRRCRVSRSHLIGTVDNARLGEGLERHVWRQGQLRKELDDCPLQPTWSQGEVYRRD